MKRQKCNLEHKAYPPCFWEQFGNPPYHSAWTIIAYRSSQKQPPKMFYKKAVLKNIAKFTRKQLHHIFFCNQIAGLSPINLQEICKFTANFLQVQVNFEFFFFNYFVEQLRTAASVDLCLQFCYQSRALAINQNCMFCPYSFNIKGYLNGRRQVIEVFSKLSKQGS